ncbi:unnamed protein product [Polarella glacialis]|uniref:Nodulin-like domain-containing protein n=1 Tax=Polarella glacialis TaxID=89957 RepID=A0A813HKU5_POLGL|nr:unnamed protein product [Polarella glacialis]
MAGANVGPAGPSPVKNGAWITFASILTMMLTAGTIYGFGEWSRALKRQDGYNLDQFQVETLALASHLGNYMVLDSGYIVSHFGTSTGFALGSSYASIGYFGMWMALALFPGQLPFWLLFVFCVLYGHGCGTIDTAAMSELMADFPQYKGYTVGCTKAYYGLATATVATIYRAAFPSKEENFLLFLAIYSALAGLILVPTVHATKGLVDQPKDKVTFKFNATAVTILLFAVMFFVVQLNAKAIDQSGWWIVLAVVVLGALSPFLLSYGALGDADADNTEVHKVQDTVHSPADMSFFQTVTSMNFYLLFVSLVACQGGGLLMIGNALQILDSFSGEDLDQTSFVSTMSIFNSLGRLLIGLGSEKYAAHLNRPWFLVISASILCVSYTLLVTAGSAVLWPAAAGVSFGYGSLWGVQAPLAQELFGPSDFAMKYTSICLAALAGSFIFSTMLAGKMFDEESERLGTVNGLGQPTCLQTSCFNTSFLVTAACTGLAVALSVWLSMRTARIYAKVQAIGSEAQILDSCEGSEDSEESSSDDRAC